jgi:hypothetical protein
MMKMSFLFFTKDVLNKTVNDDLYKIGILRFISLIVKLVDQPVLSVYQYNQYYFDQYYQ